jgi:pimeloyl-ACP methyl ester carboxylesterase
MGVLMLLVVTACTKSAPKAQPPRTTPRTTTTAGISPSASPTPAVPKIAFSDCSNQFQGAISDPRAQGMEFSCGKLAVPLDYSNPTAKTISLFVVKIHDRTQQLSEKVGSLLVNPGGPGGSGVNLAAGLVGSLSDDVFAHFDLIGFDPRGIGLSSPLECVTDKQKDQLAAEDPDVRTAAGRALARTVSDAVVKGCVAKYGSTLAHYNTEETARDMDLIRQAVGDSKLNYLGYSYGTRLGAAYAHEFPTHIRTEVLDGAVDPVADELTSDERQTKAFELAFDQFAADCLKRPACAVLGNPRAAVIALIKSADKTPLHSSLKGETRLATGGIVTTGVVSALYDQAEWKTLGDALVAARRGDAAKLFALADQYNERDPDTGHYSNILDANLAVSCNDSTLRITDALVAAKAKEWVAKYPIFGANAAASLYACHAWPSSQHPLPPASAPGAPPILVVGTVHDPATPYAASAVLAKALGSGVVLSWDGEGHTAYPKTKCITAKVNSYLLTAKLPSGDSCPAA